MSTDAGSLLKVEDLHVHFPGERARIGAIVRGQGQRAVVKAVDGVSFSVGRGETLGLVGESGCGKSTVSRALMRITKPTQGHAYLDGIDLAVARGAQLRRIRRRISMVFQDPYSSFNPRRRVGDSIAEPLVVHKLYEGRDARRRRVGDLMELVGLAPDRRNAYPHEFSGGQRQRIAIARALASDPDFIICDEAVSSLDVSVQASILNLLRRLQKELGLSYLFIAHDLAAVAYMSDRIAVMYLGRIVEETPAVDLRERPMHPYSGALLSAVRLADPMAERARKRVVLQGEVPSPAAPPSGCNFRTRCPEVFEPCTGIDPPAQQARPSTAVACHLYGVRSREDKVRPPQPEPVPGRA